MHGRTGSTQSLRARGLTASLRGALHAVAAVFAVMTMALPASAQEQVKIGIGYGLAFLPDYICQDLKLVEKYGKALHLNVKANYERFSGAGPMQDALASGAIDMAPFGAAPLLLAWEKTRNTPRQIVAISGIATLPVVLLSDRADVHSIADLRAADRIAMPTLTAPQMYFLEMQSQKTFGQIRPAAPSSDGPYSWGCARGAARRNGACDRCILLAAVHGTGAQG